MSEKQKKRIIEVLENILEDTQKDIHELEGAPFTGRSVATQFGYQGASITALAKIILAILEDKS